MIIEITLSILLILSLAANAALYRQWKLAKSNPTLDAKQLLRDLMSRGGAALRLEVLDPEGLIYWRGRR